MKGLGWEVFWTVLFGALVGYILFVAVAFIWWLF